MLLCPLGWGGGYLGVFFRTNFEKHVVLETSLSHDFQTGTFSRFSKFHNYARGARCHQTHLFFCQTALRHPGKETKLVGEGQSTVCKHHCESSTPRVLIKKILNSDEGTLIFLFVGNSVEATIREWPIYCQIMVYKIYMHICIHTHTRIRIHIYLTKPGPCKDFVK